jgi:hypothetical protein
MALSQLVEAREPIHVWHAHIEEDEIRVGLSDEREHLRPGLGLSDDLEATVGLECPLDPVEDKPMVVGNQNTHESQCGTGR